MRKLIVLVLAGLSGLAFVPSAQADTVTVTLEVELLDAAPFAVPTRCDLEVEVGSNGLDVLDEAKDNACIVDYQTQDFGFGEFVTCINKVCGQTVSDPDGTPIAGTFWGIFLDGEFASVGVSDMDFQADATLEFDYSTWGV